MRAERASALCAGQVARAGVPRAPCWRSAAILAYGFNSFADPNEQWFSSPHVFLYLATVAAAFLVYSAAMRPATKLRQSFRERVLPLVLGFIKDVRYANATTPDSFDRLPRQATGSFNRQSFDDVVCRQVRGLSLSSSTRPTLSQKAGKSSQTVFKGVVVAFETITPFPGLLVASRRAGQVSKFFRDMFGTGGLEEVQCGVARHRRDL